MINIDLVLHFLNDAVINEAFINDFEKQLLVANYDDSIEEKAEILTSIKEELDFIIRNLANDHSNCTEFTDWITDYTVPEVRVKRDFTLDFGLTDFDSLDDFEEDLRARIASILYQEFTLKNIYYLQVCENCNKIYIPKRLNKAAKFCSPDCKHNSWMNEHPEKKIEYKRKRAEK